MDDQTVTLSWGGMVFWMKVASGKGTGMRQQE